MRIAIVSPYSWTYPGGVNRHVEALATEFLERDHELLVLAPWDPPGRVARTLHRRAPEERGRPDFLVPLGRTIGLGANGAVSNVALQPGAVRTMRRELGAFAPDVVHVHEPLVPAPSWNACSYPDVPVVGTFHAYSTKAVPNHFATLAGVRRKFNQLHARIAVSEAAEWTGRRWFGGEYEVIPNGVDLAAAPGGPKVPSDELRVLFVGRPEERKGLPVLLSAFEALAEQVPSRLTVVGAERDDVERFIVDPDTAMSLDVVGRVSGEELWRRLDEADVLCAPSLAGESFGMIITEAFAAGTPVIASNIAGYADVVSDGVDGALVPPADPQRLAEELQRMHLEPARREAMGAAARRSAERYAWPNVAERVEAVYERAIEAPEPAPGPAGLARRAGLRPIDGSRRVSPQRLPSLDPQPVVGRRRRIARRAGLAVAAILGVLLTYLAASRIGLDHVISSVVRSDASWVLLAIGLMTASMALRAGAWFAIARAALPPRYPLRRRDVTSATMIGVLMSATLPARLGEPARAMVLARRTGRVRDAFPVLLGTLVSQSALNIVALLTLGAIIVSATDLFHSSSQRLFVVSLAPLLLVIAVLLAPVVVRQSGSGRAARVVSAVRAALLRVRSGLRVFRDPRQGPIAVALQLGAWALQLLACYALFDALGLGPETDIAAAAAVLFAVNVTAVVPVTPSNIGVFQLAVISVLTTGWGIGAADALAYGVILQAVEVATALALGLPALVREGVTWSDMRLRAMAAAPVRLAPRSREAPETVSS